MDQGFIRYRLKAWLIIGLLVVMSAAVFIWFYSHAYIEIEVSNPQSNSSFSYQLMSQSGQKTTTLRSPDTTTKKLVSRGSYEVLVKGGEASYYTVAKTGGFLSTTSLTAKLKAESERTFVGNNPDPCMYYDGSLLFSFGCGGPFSSLKIHQAANSSTPTSTKSPDVPLPYPVEAILHINRTNQLLLKGSGEYEVNGSKQQQFLYSINENFALLGNTSLKDITDDGSYSAQKFLKGFVVYKSDFNKVLYYSELGSKSAKISITKPDDSSLAPLGMSALNDRLAFSYSTETQSDDIQKNQAPSLNGRGVIEVYSHETHQTTTYKLDQAISNAKLCGEASLCVLSGQKLDVYDISSDHQEKLFEINNVLATESDGNKLLVVNSEGVLGIDIPSQSGSLEYSFGGYKYCGLQSVSDEGYVLCLINNKHDKVALYIDSKTPNASSIDKKILKLLQNPNIATISAYKNYIYISPNLGQLAYDSSIGGYDYSPAIKSSASKNINKLVRDIGIDTSSFTIINPYQ